MAKREVQNSEYAAFVGRIIRGFGKRAAGDVDVLPALLQAREQLDAAIQAAVEGCREEGFSWAEIGQRVGLTKQACYQRWGRK